MDKNDCLTDSRGGKKGRSQGKLAFPQRSDSKGTRTDIAITVVTSLAETMALGTTRKQKKWKLECVN